MKQQILEQFALKDRDVREISALSLAFLGDAVFELVIRTILTEQGGQPHEISRKKNDLVNAGTQAGVIQYLIYHGDLTEEEAAVFRRGRNANPRTLAKHATARDYHLATGLECLVGYLYLSGEAVRAIELIRIGIEGCGFLTA